MSREPFSLFHHSVSIPFDYIFLSDNRLHCLSETGIREEYHLTKRESH